MNARDLAAMCAFVSSAALSAPMNPGQWELGMTVVGEGVRKHQPSVTECISQQDIDDETRTLPRPEGACTLSKVKRTADSASYDLACINGAVQAQGRAEIRFAGDSYDGSVIMSVSDKGAPAQLTALRITARRVGDCTK